MEPLPVPPKTPPDHPLVEVPVVPIEVVEDELTTKESPVKETPEEPKTPAEIPPPLVLRTAQWEQKPKAKAKGRAKGKAKAKAKSKAKKSNQEVEVIESEDEAAKDAKGKSRKRSSRKEPANTEQPKAKAARKSKTKGDAKDGEGQDGGSEKNEKKDPPIKYQPVNNLGKGDLEVAFKWADPSAAGDGSTSQLPEPDMVKSFARRRMPKTSPAKEKWCAIAGSFDYHIAEWLQFYGLPIYSFEASSYMNNS